jgi:PAS domain S-box-containing protein
MTESTIQIQQAKQKLHETVRKNISFEQKAREVITLGARCLDTDSGYLTHIDQQTGYREPQVMAKSGEQQASVEVIRDLEKTYCRETINDDDSPLVLHNAPNQGWANDLATETSEFDAYLGVPLVPEEDIYGTVCFVAEDPRSDPFSNKETWFAEHLARLLERELERHEIKSQLTNQTNLAIVLNRVLRHNLRNDMSVIRGHTEMLLSQLDEDDTATIVLEHIDDLIDLSKKARELEEIISADSERRQIELAGLVEDVTESLVKKHSTETTSVEYDDEIYADVHQKFDRALEELIENALKHSGDRSTVTIGIERVPNGIKIRIQDDGPGLPVQEAEVLKAGEETPLAHGSGLGLWIANWIIASHNGSIDPVVTENGTTMLISIPQNSAVRPQRQVPELERSRDKYLAAFKEGNESKLIVNNEGQIINANSEAGSFYRLNQQELLGTSIKHYFPDDFDFDAAWCELLSGKRKRGTMTVTGADGDQKRVEYSATTDIVPGEHLIVSRDVTERQKRIRSDKFSNQTHHITGLLDPDGIVLEANKAMLTFGGLDRANVVGKPLWERNWWPGGEDTQQKLQDAIDRAATGEFVQYEIAVQGGEETAVLDFSIRPITDDQGNVTLLIAEGRDITERKERKQELQEVTSQYAALIEQFPDGAVFLFDQDLQYVRAGGSELGEIGLSSSEFEGQTPYNLFPEERAEKTARYYQATLQGESHTYQQSYQGNDYEIRTTPIRDDAGTVTHGMAVLRNISQPTKTGSP